MVNLGEAYREEEQGTNKRRCETHERIEERRRKPPPSPLKEGECSDTKNERVTKKRRTEDEQKTNE